jgi:hypothetical protein
MINTVSVCPLPSVDLDLDLWIRMVLLNYESGSGSPVHYRSVYYLCPNLKTRVFVKTSPKRSCSVIDNERFGLVFAKTRSIISGTGHFGGQWKMLLSKY